MQLIPHDAHRRIDSSRWVGLILRGEDRLEWLQGQVTNDVRKLSPDHPLSFCLCSATGQIESIVDAWTIPNGVLMTCERGTADAIRRRVDQMVILEDVSLQDAPFGFVSVIAVPGKPPSPGTEQPHSPQLSELVIPSLRGTSASRLFPGNGPDASNHFVALAGGPDIWRLPSMRGGLGGWDLWGPPEILASIELGVPLWDEAEYDAARLEAGVPVFGREWTAKTLPPELGPAFDARHVSYNKGCYVGQEILMRIFSRGHTNRTWTGLITDEPVEPGSIVAHPDRADAGVVTSAGISPSLGFIAGATIRQEFAQPGSPLTITIDGREIAAVVHPFPMGR